MVFISAINAFITRWSYDLIVGSGPDSVSLAPWFTDGVTNGLTLIASSNLMLVMAIVISIFVASEYSHGTMKNTVSKGFSKYKIYVSKIITMTAASFITLLLVFLFGMITGAIAFGKLGAIDGHAFMLLGIQLLLHAALAAYFIMVAFLIRNSGGAVAINVVLSVIPLGMLVYQILELIFKNKIHFTNYSLYYNINYFSPTASIGGTDILRAVIVALVMLAVTTALGILAFREMDVK